MLLGAMILHSWGVEKGFSAEKERKDDSDICKSELNKHCLAMSVWIGTINVVLSFLSDFSLPDITSAKD